MRIEKTQSLLFFFLFHSANSFITSNTFKFLQSGLLRDNLLSTIEKTNIINMDSEIQRIRRERWLQSQKKNDDESSSDARRKASPALRTQSWLEDLNADAQTKDEKKDIGMEEDSKPAAKVIKKARVKAPNKASSVKETCIDLTNSDDDDDIVILDATPKTSLKRKQPRSAVDENVKVESNSSSSTSIDKNDDIMPFTICTYNIWFERPNPSARMTEIARLISEQSPRPTFIGLQEVTPELLSHLSPLLRSLGYDIKFQRGVTYGVALCVLTEDYEGGRALNDSKMRQKHSTGRILEFGFEEFPSRMARGLMWARCSIPSIGGEVLFTTTHLESYIPSNDGSREREQQIKIASEFCLAKLRQTRSVKMAFITGDLNWDDERVRSKGANKILLSLIPHRNPGIQQWSDAWLDMNPGEAGFTYDSKENPMLKGSMRRRFDRCIVCFRDEKMFALTQAELIGKDAIAGLQWQKLKYNREGKPTGEVDNRPLAASDHFGLLVTIGKKQHFKSKNMTKNKPKK